MNMSWQIVVTLWVDSKLSLCFELLYLMDSFFTKRNF